jgi:hypothetical protein
MAAETTARVPKFPLNRHWADERFDCESSENQAAGADRPVVWRGRESPEEYATLLQASEPEGMSVDRRPVPRQ